MSTLKPNAVIAVYFDIAGQIVQVEDLASAKGRTVYEIQAVPLASEQSLLGLNVKNVLSPNLVVSNNSPDCITVVHKGVCYKKCS